MIRSDRDELLDALDRVREVRGSLPLFDALLSEDVERVRAALTAHPRHPLRPRFVHWLEARGAAPPEEASAEAALARHGITDVDAWVVAAHAREAALVRSLADARAEGDRALRAANAYALIAALLALLAVAGWLTALGPLRLQEVPTGPPGQPAAGTATGAR